MRPSTKKTTAAVLRKLLGTDLEAMKDRDMAELLKTSVSTIHSLESGRLKLSPSLAKRMFHETGISLEWLLGKKPEAPPIGTDGKPYTRATFERVQANKIYYDQPHPVLRNTDSLGFCARLIAILESASAGKDYYMALYKVHTALDSLQQEFGIDEKLYQHSGPHSVNTTMAVAALKQVLARNNDLQRLIKEFKESQHPTPKPTKKRPSKKRRR
jgi:transcriptional regulator with XRE-family HTH domain